MDVIFWEFGNSEGIFCSLSIFIYTLPLALLAEATVLSSEIIAAL